MNRFGVFQGSWHVDSIERLHQLYIFVLEQS